MGPQLLVCVHIFKRIWYDIGGVGRSCFSYLCHHRRPWRHQILGYFESPLDYYIRATNKHFIRTWWLALLTGLDTQNNTELDHNQRVTDMPAQKEEGGFVWSSSSSPFTIQKRPPAKSEGEEVENPSEELSKGPTRILRRWHCEENGRIFLAASSKDMGLAKLLGQCRHNRIKLKSNTALCVKKWPFC